MATTPTYGYDVLAAQQQPTGFAGLLSSPVGQGLLAAGLGAMASRGNTMQALGRGGLLGLSAYGQAQGAQENRLLQMAQAKMKQDALAKLTPGADGAIGATPETLVMAGFNDPSKWADIRNAGRDKFKQNVTATGADGSQQLYGVDEYGGVKSMGLTNAPEIKTVDLGGQHVGVNPYTGQQAWKADKTLTPEQEQKTANEPFMMVDGQIVPNPAYQKFAKEKAAAGAARTDVRVTNKTGESLAGQIGPMMKESQVAANAAARQIGIADDIDRALESGKVISGPLANARMTVEQWASALNVPGQDREAVLENTRSAMRGLAQLTLEGRKQMRGEGQISNSESALAERAMSGDLSMTPAEMRVLTNAARRAGGAIYEDHNRKLRAVAENPDFAPMVPFYSVTAPRQQAAQPAQQVNGFKIVGVR